MIRPKATFRPVFKSVVLGGRFADESLEHDQSASRGCKCHGLACPDYPYGIAERGAELLIEWTILLLTSGRFRANVLSSRKGRPQ